MDKTGNFVRLLLVQSPPMYMTRWSIHPPSCFLVVHTIRSNYVGIASIAHPMSPDVDAEIFVWAVQVADDIRIGFHLPSRKQD